MVLTFEQKQLVENNYGLIFSFLHSNRLDEEEFYDIAAIGLCKAALKYIPGNSTFSTYAYICMKTQIIKEFQKRYTQKAIPNDKICSYNVLINNDDKNQIEMVDVFSDDIDHYEYVISKVYIEQLIALTELTSVELNILQDVLDGFTQTEIAKMYGCTRQNINKIVERIKRKIKKSLRA